MIPEALLDSLRAAVAAAPNDVVLRVHFAELLWAAGRRDDAVREAAVVLQQDPSNASALGVIAGLVPGSVSDAKGGQGLPTAGTDSRDDVLAGRAEEDVLARLDAELGDVVPPRFVAADGGEGGGLGPVELAGAFDAESVTLRLADVGGMHEVKARLEAAVLAPLRNPELGRLYAKSLRGGLLLYGPPGCGKTFIARALAGEMGARFIAVSLADVLDMWVGQSERNVRELFDLARRHAPTVLFFDEVDAIGQKRSQMRNNAARGAVNQLLSEMDGVAGSNDGVFVLGATNHPWDVDVALRRPGRFDRMLLVLPPDSAAREAILRHHLQNRPVANINLSALAARTDGYSGADLAYVCESATERAMLDSVRTGTVRLIEMGDVESALTEIRPSIGLWLDTARNVAQFANADGSYDDLASYLKQRRLR